LDRRGTSRIQHLRDCIFLFADEAFWAVDKWSAPDLDGKEDESE
jgi:hypothetical protein